MSIFLVILAPNPPRTSGTWRVWHLTLNYSLAPRDSFYNGIIMIGVVMLVFAGGFVVAFFRLLIGIKE